MVTTIDYQTSNVTTQVVTQQAQPDIISAILSNPIVWLCILAAIVGFIVLKLMDKRGKPEQKPFYGLEVREGMTVKTMKKRLVTWGTKKKYTLHKGFNRAGKTIRVDIIPQIIDGDVESEYLEVSFRKFGFWAWVMAFFGRYEILMIDPQVVTVDDKKKQLFINPRAHIIQDSGIWTLKNKKEIKLIDDYNVHLDLQNTKGFVTDFPRRLMSLDPRHSGIADVREIDAELKEKERQNKTKSWAGG